MPECICVKFVVICCCVPVFGCVSVFGGVVDVLECGLFLESMCIWVYC